MSANDNKAKSLEIDLETTTTQELVEIVYRGKSILVNKAVADYLEDCRRDGKRQSASKRRNQSDVQCEDDYVEFFMAEPPVSFVADLMDKLDMEQLPRLIEKLPELQRRRLVAYYYEGLTYREIATRECVHYSAVQRSVKLAEDNLKKYFQ